MTNNKPFNYYTEGYWLLQKEKFKHNQARLNHVNYVLRNGYITYQAYDYAMNFDDYDRLLAAQDHIPLNTL